MTDHQPKGLDLAGMFFREYGLPTLEREFPELVGRLGAGLLGFGSDVLGADDALSRDHGWGPRFYVFLSEDDFQSFGDDVKTRLNDLKPEEFQRYRPDLIEVFTADGFYERLTRSPWPPETVKGWADARILRRKVRLEARLQVRAKTGTSPRARVARVRLLLFVVLFVLLLLGSVGTLSQLGEPRREERGESVCLGLRPVRRSCHFPSTARPAAWR